MATPHLAGGAAVVRWLYPSWSAAQVRSAIVNTADKNVLKQSSGTALESNVNIIGAGRENLLAAVNAVVALEPVSVSFGAVPSGSGQTQAFTVSVRNMSAGAAAFSVSITGSDSSVSYSVNPASLSLSSGSAGNITVTMDAAKNAAVGGHQGQLSIGTAGQEVAHAAVFTSIR